MKIFFDKVIKPFLFGLLLFIPPIILYFFIKSIYLLAIIYWVVFFQIYKYRERSKKRTWQLAQFLSERWTVEKREEERIKLTSNFLFMHELKDEYPELFKDGLLKLP